VKDVLNGAKFIYIYYHKVDFDGYIGQYVLYNHLIEANSTYEIKRIPYNYSDNFNELPDFEKLDDKDRKQTVLIFVDISPYQQSGLVAKLWNIFHDNLIIIDHHETAVFWLKDFEKSENCIINGIQSVNYSGCELAAIWCKNYNAKELSDDEVAAIYKEQVPQLVKFVGRYDVHDTKNLYGVADWKEIEAFQFGLRCADIDFYKPKEFFSNKIKDFLHNSLSIYTISDFRESSNEFFTSGFAVCNYLLSRNKKLLAIKEPITARFVTKVGRRIIRHDKSYFASDILNNSKIFEDNGVYGDPAALYILANYNITSGLYNVTLYSTDQSEIDVGKLCDMLGGGGHRHCAGFQCEYMVYKNNHQLGTKILDIK
jgi:hypothetical protein